MTEETVGTTAVQRSVEFGEACTFFWTRWTFKGRAAF